MWDLKFNEESRTTPRFFADSHGANWALPKFITPKSATEIFLRFPLITMISVLPSFNLSFLLAIQIFKSDKRDESLRLASSISSTLMYN